MAKNEPTREAADKVQGKPDAPTNLPKGYKVGRLLTAPLVSLVYSNNLSVIVDGEMVGGMADPTDPKAKKPMTVMPCTRMDDGSEITLIVPTVLESALRRTPGGYVGKAFYMRLKGKKAGKGYHDIDVFELEDG